MILSPVPWLSGQTCGSEVILENGEHEGHVVQPVGAPDRVPPPIKWTLTTNDKEGVYNGNRENEKSSSV